MLSKELNIVIDDQEGRAREDILRLTGFAKKKMWQYVDLLNSLGQEEGRKTMQLTDGTILEFKPNECFGKVHIRIPVKKVGKVGGEEFKEVEEKKEVIIEKIRYPLKAMQTGVLPCYTLINAAYEVIGYLPVIRTGEELGYFFERQRWSDKPSDIRNEGHILLQETEFDTGLLPDSKIKIADFDEVEDVEDHGVGLYLDTQQPVGDIVSYHIPMDFVSDKLRPWFLKIYKPSGTLIKDGTWGPYTDPISDGLMHGDRCGDPGVPGDLRLKANYEHITNEDMFPEPTYEVFPGSDSEDTCFYDGALQGFSDCAEGPWLGVPSSGLWGKYYLAICYREAEDELTEEFLVVYDTASASKWYALVDNTFNLYVNCSGEEFLVVKDVTAEYTKWNFRNNTLRIYDSTGGTYFLYSFIMDQSDDICKYYYGVIVRGKDALGNYKYTHYQSIYDARKETVPDEDDRYVHDIESSGIVPETFVSNGDFFLINADNKYYNQANNPAGRL